MAKTEESQQKTKKPVPLPEPKSEIKEGVPQFSIAASDPFVDGIARMCARLDPKADPSARPLILRADGPAAIAVLKSYRQRANGAGDKARTAIADEAIKAFEQKKI